jgi:hypothetical protein
MKNLEDGEGEAHAIICKRGSVLLFLIPTIFYSCIILLRAERRMTNNGPKIYLIVSIILKRQ